MQEPPTMADLEVMTIRMTRFRFQIVIGWPRSCARKYAIEAVEFDLLQSTLSTCQVL